MAVGRLTGKWVLEILQSNHPDGILRRSLLDEFATLLVSKRSSSGAKGRLARRLYAKLNMLQRRGDIVQEEGIVRPFSASGKPAKVEVIPLLGPILRKKQFLALMAEDRNPNGPKSARLRVVRWDFLACAIESGWTIPQAANALGITVPKATDIIANPPSRSLSA
jgi:hypothetical protein